MDVHVKKKNKTKTHFKVEVYTFKCVSVVLFQVSNYSAISWGERFTFRRIDNDVRFVLDQHTY